MMTEARCLWCHKSLRYGGSLADMFSTDDCLCDECRQTMNFKPRIIRAGNLHVLSLYPYEGLVREMMIQYKEKYDEALFPVFLWPHVRVLNFLYRGYVMLPMPSSSKNIRERGFHTVDELFSLLDITQIQALRKTRDVDQKYLSASERSRISDYMELDFKKLEGHRKILLADDIITTGATFSAAASFLSGKAAKIKAISISYVRKQ